MSEGDRRHETPLSFWPAADAVTATPTPANIAFAIATLGTTTPQTLTASFAVSGYMGTFTPTAAMHYGHDYTLGAANCTTHSSSTETCTFAITFRPTLPGSRKDALVVSSGSTTLVTVLVNGVGNGPLAAFNPGVSTRFATPNYAYNATVDENGNAYAVSATGATVYKLSRAGVVSTLPLIGLMSPHGIAIDGAGTLYIAQNAYGKKIVTYSAAGIQGSITVNPPAPYVPCGGSNGGTLEYLYSVAVDGAGNLFTLEIECNEIFELKTNGTYATTSINPSMLQPAVLTLDAEDNLYIGGFAINKLPSSGSQTQININGVNGLGVDASGTLYATGYPTTSDFNFGVTELQPSDYTTPAAGLDAGNPALGIGVGSDGTVVVGEGPGFDVIDRSQSAMAFGFQTAGVQSQPQIAQLVNIGNQPLTVSSVALVNAADYTMQPVASQCADGVVIAPATYCQVEVTLNAPHPGTWNGSLVITTDSLNHTGTKHTVALTGAIEGVYVVPSPSTLSFIPQAVDTTSTAQSVTLTNNGLVDSAVLDGVSSSSSAFVASPGTCTAAFAVGGSCKPAVTFNPSAVTSYTGTITATLGSTGGTSQTLTFNVTGTGVPVSTTSTLGASGTTVVVGRSITFTATVAPVSGTAMATGTVTFKDGSATLGTGTLDSTGNATYTTSSLGVGTHSIKAAYGGSTTATASVSAPLTINISAAPPMPLRFVAVIPCRVVDTRGGTGAFGGPELGAGATREFDIPQSGCGIPSTAVAYSLNVTVVPTGPLDYLTLWPAGQTQPGVSTLNSLDGRLKANAAITPAGQNGGVDVFVSDATNLILDIDGYFVPATTASALAFYPVTPCRVADTRKMAGALGGPLLTAGSSRDFPVQSSACALPANAQAYSLNVTAIPHTTLNYLTTWPSGQGQPNVSTLNASTGAITANAAIVPAGSGGDVSIFVSDAADVILDVNGYFAPPATDGLSLYTAAPCRVLDTRGGIGIVNGVVKVGVQTSSCAPAAAAKAYVLNATVVPPGELDYLTLWPDGSSQPDVSTLNALDGAITSNMAIVPVTNGKVDAYSSNSTQVILDISSYFAP